VAPLVDAQQHRRLLAQVLHEQAARFFGIAAALDEYGWMFVALAAIYSVLALGLYALWLVGVSVAAVLAIAGALAVLVIVILARALLAAGSADYPYDDQ
jgi:hypothetical protein